MSNRKRSWLTCFIAHRLELFLSPSWELAPRTLKKALERLEIEHLRHGGFNNGHLFVSYDAFVDYGISRRSVRGALQLGVDLGLVEIIHGVPTGADIRPASSYRLTYVPAKGKAQPSDDWKTVTRERAIALLAAYKADEKAAAAATRKAEAA